MDPHSHHRQEVQKTQRAQRQPQAQQWKAEDRAASEDCARAVGAAQELVELRVAVREQGAGGRGLEGYIKCGDIEEHSSSCIGRMTQTDPFVYDIRKYLMLVYKAFTDSDLSYDMILHK